MSLQAVELHSADEVRAHAASVRARMRSAYSPSQSFIDVTELRRQLSEVTVERDSYQAKCAELQTAYERLLINSTSAAATQPSPSSVKKTVGVKDVLRVVADLYRIASHEIPSRNTYGYIIEPRDVAIYLLRTVKTMQLKAIGAALGGRHHTTCLHAFNKVALRRRSDPAFDQKIVSLTAALAEADNAKT